MTDRASHKRTFVYFADRHTHEGPEEAEPILERAADLASAEGLEGLTIEWVGAIEKAVRLAIDEGHFPDDVDAAQVAFEINAIFFGANYAYNMRHDKKAIARAWHAIETRLESLRQAPRPSRFARPEKRPLRRRAS
ncbi:MAG TPA: hypothetical protein VH087_16425 [Thermoanaerobaculia bacterium]|nr:hypothetical protein [Thermoanaerobaculia bacterium]